MRAFSALVAAKNFTRAADQCNLTQSAFSALIANLETGLGLKLFSRNTRNVELTPEGEVPTCDWLVLALPLTDETRGLIDARRLSLMARHARVVNIARGELLDEPALIAALNESGSAAHTSTHSKKSLYPLVPRYGRSLGYGYRRIIVQPPKATNNTSWTALCANCAAGSLHKTNIKERCAAMVAITPSPAAGDTFEALDNAGDSFAGKQIDILIY